MTAIPYLSFDGACREAFEHYREIFGGDLEIVTIGESPIADEMPAEHGDRVMYAGLTSGDLVLMGGDAPVGRYAEPRGVAINLQTDSVDEGARIFHAFEDGGKVVMSFEETFWVERFGMVTDRFGTPWMINAGKPAS